MTKRVEIPPDAAARQLAIAREIGRLHSTRSTPPLAMVDTYGCQQNEADSERLRGFLSEMGYQFTDSEREADIIVINTCAVREHAEQRVYGNVGALTHTKRDKPDQIIALCGCMMQQPHVAERIRKSFGHVDIVFGPHALWRFPELVKTRLTERGRIFEIEDSDGAIVEGLPTRRQGGPKAWLPVMYGCNNYCTYCVVPHVRGRERSREPERVLADARRLVDEGVRDITLLGQNVNSYGKDSGQTADFAWLIEAVNAIPGDFRIRFMTSHPKDAGERLFAAMARSEKAARHIHLPFQAGSSRVLRAMNRGYTKEQYLDLIGLARRHMPDVVLTSDIIVGFPGETEEDFRHTLDVLRQVRFDALFTFIYSPRTGTPAADMPDPVTRAEKQSWFDELVALQNGISAEKHRAYVGTRQRVLIDGTEDDPRYGLTARTDGNRLVRLAGDRGLVGTFADVEITEAATWSLVGRLAQP